MPELPTVAYLTSVYPRASDSFIRSEIKSLRSQGMCVQTVSIRRADSVQLVSDELAEEAASTHYLLDRGLLGLIAAVVIRLVSHPIGFLRAARLLFLTHPTGLGNRARQLAYLAEAACLTRLLQKMGIRHIHNHIGENSASVAMIAAEMGDLTYSLTIHGPGIFFHPRQWALGEKIERSAFTACITRFCMSQCMIFTDPQAWRKLRVVRCGIDAHFFHAESRRPPKAARFVCVGRLCHEKGHLLLLEAVKRLVAEGLPIELHLIGDGELRDEIEAFVSDSQLNESVIIHGWASSAQIREQLTAARALILPSFAEGLPVVFMEALAMERPVIATQIAGIPELVEDGNSGWIVPPAHVESLVDAIRDAAERSVAEIEQMGRFGRAGVERRHDCRQEAMKIYQLVCDVLDGNPIASQEDLESVLKEQLKDEHVSVASVLVEPMAGYR